MWISYPTKSSDQTTHYQIGTAGGLLKFSEVIDLWIDDPAFREWYSDLLSKADFAAYFWEHPPFTRAELSLDYEFVLVNSSQLPRIKANPKPFQGFFNKKSLIVDFPNLRGDAHLVVPVALHSDTDYSHLASFLCSAEKKQIDQFWKKVGHTFKQKINHNPLWLSTHGLGVAWLHVRIDQRPKYYHHSNYMV